MRSGIVDWWIRIRASYWFIPSVMAVMAIVAAVGFVQIDRHLGAEWLLDYRWFYASKPAGARALLSTVAGSMITVAGVTFSMTLLAVSHASAQIGPRLLTAFMRDRGNQMTLGTFTATFLYCLLVLRTIHVGDSLEDTAVASVFVPHLAVLVATALAVLSVAVFIYFIHHVPQSINVSYVVGHIGNDLVDSIRRLYPEHIGERLPRGSSGKGDTRAFDKDSQCIPVTEQCGYLRVLDTDGLMEVTESNDLVLKMYLRPGDFGITGQTLLEVGPVKNLNSDVIDDIYSIFSWGIERTPEQDVMFPAEQLIEVLGKAMSPGINGQYTALQCLNQYERALAELLARSVPDAHRYDSSENLRVIAKPIDHQEFMSLTLSPIRQFIRGDWIASDHVLQIFDRLAKLPQLSQEVPLIEDARQLVMQDIVESQMSPMEKRTLQFGQVTRR